MNRFGRTPGGGAVALAPLLRTSFPDVQELRIEMEFEEEWRWAPSMQVHVLHPPARLLLRYACPFPGCTGKFDLEEPVTRLLKDSTRSFTADMRCTGTRPRKGDPTATTCSGHMSLRVAARYTRHNANIACKSETA